MSALEQALGGSIESLRELAEEWAAGARAKKRWLDAERSASLRIIRPRRPDEEAAGCGCLVRKGRVVQPCAVVWRIHDAIAELGRMGPGVGALIQLGERAWDRHIGTARGGKEKKWKRQPRQAEG